MPSPAALGDLNAAPMPGICNSKTPQLVPIVACSSVACISIHVFSTKQTRCRQTRSDSSDCPPSADPPTAGRLAASLSPLSGTGSGQRRPAFKPQKVDNKVGRRLKRPRLLPLARRWSLWNWPISPRSTNSLNSYRLCGFRILSCAATATFSRSPRSSPHACYSRFHVRTERH
ncbi:hypothetical protein LY76DRAFT_392939 [Colletotrichum caudatum]|nr:hypothetical protein LY76DRAFT_392939 [Colletotrichum caudatum]